MTRISRKNLLKAAAAAGVATVVAQPAFAEHQAEVSLEPTPFCDDGDDPTPPQIEGPYFKPNSPQRTSMLDGAGTRLTVKGFVFGLACQPIANALLDFWQADSQGAYDNVTYRFRGHQFTDAQGAFSLSTIVPGLYPGRTRHLHVKLQAPNRPILTTQLYFPNEPRNSTDSLFNSALLMTVRSVGTGREASFDFVLNVPGGPGGPGSPSPSPSIPPGSTTWAAYTPYVVGARVSYSGVNYQCQIAHTSLPGWEPPNAPALWQRL
jgi:protocatechuate 3,4-dioxygenase beta subunit